MRKIISVLLILLLLTGCSVSVGCAPSGSTGNGGQTEKHTFSNWVFDNDKHYRFCTDEGCTEIEESVHQISEDKCVCGYELAKDVCAEHSYLTKGVVDRQNLSHGFVFYTQKCDNCDYINITKAIIVRSSSLNSTINSAENGAVLYLNTGIYSNIEVTKPNVTLIADESAIISYASVKDGGDGATFIDCEFMGQLNLDDVTTSINVLCLYDCKFSGSANIMGVNGEITNLLVDGCEFIEITATNTSAIYLARVKNLTVKNSVFDDVAYNGMNIGNANGYVDGDIIITGNTFKNIVSRMLYFVQTNGGVTYCDISNNIFYDNSEICNRDNGQYVKAGCEGIVVGVNTWENVPMFVQTYFDGPNIEYDKEVQLELE